MGLDKLMYYFGSTSLGTWNALSLKGCGWISGQIRFVSVLIIGTSLIILLLSTATEHN